MWENKNNQRHTRNEERECERTKKGTHETHIQIYTYSWLSYMNLLKYVWMFVFLSEYVSMATVYCCQYVCVIFIMDANIIIITNEQWSIF